MTYRLFLNAIENPGGPDLNIPKMHVVYNWDLTLGKKKSADITAADVVSFTKTLPQGAEFCIDLEPPKDEPECFSLTLSQAVVQKTCQRFSEMLDAVAAERPDLVVGVMYCPFKRYLFEDDDVNCGRAAMLLGEMKTKPGVLAFDFYRLDPDRAVGTGRSWADDFWDVTLEAHLHAAKSFSRPLRVFMSPFRQGWDGQTNPPTPMPLTQFRSDLMRVATKIDPYNGDRIVLWNARVRDVPKGQDPTWRWDPSWDWHVCLPRVEGAVLG